jgi:transcriptional regulator with XRE-family HTH domain
VAPNVFAEAFSERPPTLVRPQTNDPPGSRRRSHRTKRAIRATRDDSAVMGRRSQGQRRTPTQAAADRNSDELALRLGRMLRDARRVIAATQQEAAGIAGISRGTWSGLETGGDGRITLATWNRAAFAVGSRLDAFLKRASSASQPRDAVHLRHQELIIRAASSGGWRALPEEPIDREARSSRAADVLLQRGTEYALIEVWDWFDDVGGALRDWDRRLATLERYSIARMTLDAPLPTYGGCWVLRATQWNRRLVQEHRHLFRARFPGSAPAWLAGLTSTKHPTPSAPGLLWVAVGSARLFPARLG